MELTTQKNESVQGSFNLEPIGQLNVSWEYAKKLFKFVHKGNGEIKYIQNNTDLNTSYKIKLCFKSRARFNELCAEFNPDCQHEDDQDEEEKKQEPVGILET